MKSIELRCTEGSSDKVYRLSLEESGPGYVVNFAYGRYGTALNTGTKTNKPVSLTQAEAVFAKLVDEKRAKGYRTVGSNVVIPVVNEKIDTGLRPQLLNMISEAEAETYIKDDDWGCQEKYDGKHMLLDLSYSGKTTAANKKGQQIPVPYKVGATLEDAVMGPWTLDGELIGDKLYAFDLLLLEEDFRDYDYETRHANLEQTFGGLAGPYFQTVDLIEGTKAKRAFVKRMKAEGREGVVFKKLSAKFSEGRPSSGGNMLKLKFWSSCSCVVLRQHKSKRSIEVALGGVNMGSVTIPPNYDVPEPGQVVEVKYLYVVGQGGSLYQPIYLGVRDDVDANECTIEKQHLKYKAAEECSE